MIAQCHVNGDSNLFIEFMLRQIDQILKEVLLQSEGQRENISEYVKRLLDVMEYEVPYTAVTLMELLGLKVKGIISQELSESGNRTSIDTNDSS